jgi:hypothetical protein
MTDVWTIERVADARPELAPMARLHAAIETASRRVASEAGAALHPAFAGAPAVHWMAGRSLLDSSNRAALAPAAARLFDAVASAAGDSVPGARAAVDEIRAAARAPSFGWPARLVRFRELPEDVPHAALFRFLLLRTVAVPAGHLAGSFSAPHAERWVPAACPWCGVPAAAAVAGQGAGRTLLCVLCGGRWTRDGLGCIACGEERAEQQLVLASRELGPASLEACATCRHAIKLFAPGDLVDGPPVALEVLTVHLDVLARSDDLSRDATALAAVYPPA